MSVEREFRPKGEQVGGLHVCLAQKLLTPEHLTPKPELALRELQGLNERLGARFGLELLPCRLTPLPEERFWASVVGVHGPLQANLTRVLRVVAGGGHLPLKERLVAVGIALRVGTEEGPLSLFYPGGQIARQLDVYYNLHPDIASSIREKHLRFLVERGIILIENGWYDQQMPLSHDPQIIKDFKEKYGLGSTLDVTHALQAYEANPGQEWRKQGVASYLRGVWETLDPLVVHLSDRGREDHYPLGHGKYSELVGELVKEMGKKKNLVVIFEVRPEFHPQAAKGLSGQSLVEFVIDESMDFLRRHL